MNYEKLTEYVAELEARLIVAEKFINQVNQVNNLKVPSDNDVQSELSSQRSLSKSKYKKLLNA